MSKEKAFRDLNSFFDDDNIKRKLTLISLQISMFELINYQIINKLKYFYNTDLTIVDGKITVIKETQNYIDEVRNLYKKDLFKSSAFWYKTKNIIDEEEFDLLIKFRNQRNTAAHEIIIFCSIVILKLRKINLYQLKRLTKKYVYGG